MSRYPKLDQHCPIEGRIDDALDGSFCRRCQTMVYDLDALDEAARLRLLAAPPQGKICVRYRMPATLAAAIIATGIGASPALAQTATTAETQQTVPAPDATEPSQEQSQEIVGTFVRLTPEQQARQAYEIRKQKWREARGRRRAEKAARHPPQ